MKAALFIALAVQVAAIGAQVAPGDVWRLVRRPAWILRIALAMFVATPLLGVVLARTLATPPVMKGAMLVLAISAAAPLLPGKLLKLGIDAAHDTALTLASIVLAMAVVPLEARLLGAWFGYDVLIGEGAVARVLAISFLAPLVAGMLIQVVLGERVRRIAPRVMLVGTALMAVPVLVIVVAQFGTLVALLQQSAGVVVLFAAGSLLIGHAIGGPAPEERTSLAIATVTRHPGLALLIATTNFPESREAPTAIVAFVAGIALATVPYTLWRKRQLSVHPASPVVA
jgi:BASS family bile acid:Na+ symporter